MKKSSAIKGIVCLVTFFVPINAGVTVQLINLSNQNIMVHLDIPGQKWLFGADDPFCTPEPNTPLSPNEAQIAVHDSHCAIKGMSIDPSNTGANFPVVIWKKQAQPYLSNAVYSVAIYPKWIAASDEDINTVNNMIAMKGQLGASIIKTDTYQTPKGTKQIVSIGNGAETYKIETESGISKLKWHAAVEQGEYQPDFMTKALTKAGNITLESMDVLAKQAQSIVQEIHLKEVMEIGAAVATGGATVGVSAVGEAAVGITEAVEEDDPSAGVEAAAEAAEKITGEVAAH